MHQGGQEVVDRKLKLCLKLQKFEIEDLILTCGICGHFFLYCCPCSREDPQLHERPCHHLHLVFTDGACSNNGRPNATAGAGIAYGSEPGSQHDIPITETSDSGQRRTSQRAELWAATYGLAFVKKAARRSERLKTKEERATNPDGQSEDLIIIATDSEYVVKGMTQWLPTWKENKMRTGQNKKPANLDLFLRLDKFITSYESKYDVKIGFWHIPREYNHIADGLAKKAAQRGDLGLAAPPTADSAGPRLIVKTPSESC